MLAPKIVKLDPRSPDSSKFRDVVYACRDGQIVVFPTETVYGIGAKMSVSGIEHKIREIKGRSEQKPFSYHIGDWPMLDMLGVEKTPMLRHFAGLFWPGPVTFLLKNKNGKKIGVRFPKNKIACALIVETGEPFIATSANKSGQPSPHTAKQVTERLGSFFDLLIDGGRTEFAADSTVLDLSGTEPVIVRKGAWGADVEKAVEKVKAGTYARKKILIVCTGNSCRSPMAEGWLRLELEKKGLQDVIEISSCGIGAREGLPASVESEFVVKNHGIDLSRHKSRQCRKGDVWGADLILVMAEHHAESVEETLYGAKKKTLILDVADPIGFGVAVYEATFAQIAGKLKMHLNEIIKIH